MLAGVVVVLAAAAGAGWWSHYVPIFQAPDELVLYDYVDYVFRSGHLPSARMPISEGYVQPWTRYLEHATAADLISFRAQVKAPRNYGTRDYFAGLDLRAPTDPAEPVQAPYLVDRYPFLYYYLEAQWLHLAAPFIGPAVTAQFFTARAFNVLLLLVSLLATWGCCVRLRLGRWRSVATVAVVGFLPVTPYIASYIQPDNLGMTLVALACWITLGLRTPDGRWGWPGLAATSALLGIVLGMLFVTKYQYGLVTSLACAGAVAAHAGWRRAAAAGGLAAIPVGLFLAVQGSVQSGSPHPLVYHTVQRAGLWTDVALRTAAARGPGALVVHLASGTVRAARDFYFGGPSFTSFWGVFGWEDTQLVIRSLRVEHFVLWGLRLGTVAVVGLALIRAVAVLRRSRRLWVARRRRGVLRALLGNPVINSYLLFTGFMFAFYVYTDDTFFAQGRNWLPFLFGGVLYAWHIAPRALPRPARRVAGGALLAGLLIYAVVGSAYAVPTLRDRYYDRGRQVATLDASTLPDMTSDQLAYRVEEVTTGIDVKPAPGADLVSGPDSPLAIHGWAADLAARAPVRAVFLLVDGRPEQAVYGDHRPDVAAGLHLSSCENCGFDLTLPPLGLSSGLHTLSLRIVDATGTYAYTPPWRVRLEVR